jgi:hypothetical protein
MIGIATSASRTDFTVDNVYIDVTAGSGSAIEVGGEKFSIRNCKLVSDQAAIKSRHFGLWDGVIADNIHESWGSGAFIEMQFCERVAITGNVTDSPNDGIVLRGSPYNTTIVGNVIRFAGNDAIRVESNCRHIVVSSNTIDSPGGAGIKFDQSTECTGAALWNEISDNVITGATGNGIQLVSQSNIQVLGNIVEQSGTRSLSITWASGYGNPESVSVIGNQFNNGGGVLVDGVGISGFLHGFLYTNNSHFEETELKIQNSIKGALVSNNLLEYTAVRFEDADGSKFSDNLFTDMVPITFPFTETGCVTVVASDDVTIDGNTITGLQSTGTYAAIELAGTMTRAKIISNYYNSNAPSGTGVFANGLTIGASVTSTTIHGNDFSAATTPINDSGTGTVDLHDFPPPRAFHTYAVTGNFATGTGTLRIPITTAQTVANVRAMCGTAPTTTDVIFDVNKNGTTIYTTQANRPTITAGTNDSGNTSAPDVTALAAGDYLTIDIDQVGTGTVGADGTVIVEVTIP